MEQPPPSSAEQNQKEYDNYVQDAWKSIDVSSDSFDQALLTYSASALGLSLAFIKDVVPLDQAICRGVLYASWISFTLCIGLTISSFFCSAQAHRVQISYAEEAYLRGKPDAWNKRSVWHHAVGASTVGGGVAFVTGLLLTVFFCIINVYGGHFGKRSEQATQANTVYEGQRWEISQSDEAVSSKPKRNPRRARCSCRPVGARPLSKTHSSDTTEAVHNSCAKR
jgi:hypothetical protein